MTQLDPPLYFSPLHTWARAERDGSVTIGITEYAQYELGELQYVGLPRVGSTVKKDASFGEVESVKTASELHAPCSGTVIAINAELADEPSIVNNDPYGEGWIIRVDPADIGELETLDDRSVYEAQTAGLSH